MSSHLCTIESVVRGMSTSFPFTLASPGCNLTEAVRNPSSYRLIPKVSSTLIVSGTFIQGRIKFLIPSPRGGGEFIKSVGEEYHVVKRGREYHGCGDLPYIIKAAGKNIKCGERKGNFGEENQN